MHCNVGSSCLRQRLTQAFSGYVVVIVGLACHADVLGVGSCHMPVHRQGPLLWGTCMEPATSNMSGQSIETACPHMAGNLLFVMLRQAHALTTFSDLP